VWRVQGRTDSPNHWHGLAHFFAFGESLVDRFGAWTGRLDRVDIDAIEGANFEAMRNDKRGSLILSAHVGATEIVRAMATRYQKRRITIVIHSAQAPHYNALIKRFAPQSQVSLVQAGEFSIETAMALSAAIERGEWVVIMGDRMPVKQSDRSITANFLGGPTEFPQGPFVLAAALRCPIYTLFCTKQGGRHRVSVSARAVTAKPHYRGWCSSMRPPWRPSCWRRPTNGSIFMITGPWTGTRRGKWRTH
jgi:predicted LPLAT superfamily acyltransferase